METREMTKEQLIAQIDALNEQVVGLKKTETPDKKVEADLQASDDRSQFPFITAPRSNI